MGFAKRTRVYKQMGGHGGLNILPQKSWNVYNRDNRQRVERDEARVAAEAAEARRRAEGEAAAAGLQSLRARSSTRTDTPSAAAREHVNFFAAEERALDNFEHAAEKKAEAARLEARVMPDLQLDRSAREPAPWYTKASVDRAPPAAAEAVAAPAAALHERRPLAGGPTGWVMTSAGAVVVDNVDGGAGQRCRRKTEKRHKRAKKEKRKQERSRRRRHDDSGESSSDEKAGGQRHKKRRSTDEERNAEAAMQRMRQERLDREVAEGLRERSVMTFGCSDAAVGGRSGSWAAEEQRMQRELTDEFLSKTGQTVSLPPRSNAGRARQSVKVAFKR